MTTIEANARVTETAAAARDAGDGSADEARSRVGQIRVTVEGAVEHVPAVLESARTGAERVTQRLPGAAARARLGVAETTITLQALPDPTLRLLAAASLGLASGLYLAGTPRLLILAAGAPALLAGGAMATRPGATLGGVGGRTARLAGKETDR